MFRPAAADMPNDRFSAPNYKGPMTQLATYRLVMPLLSQAGHGRGRKYILATAASANAALPTLSGNTRPVLVGIDRYLPNWSLASGIKSAAENSIHPCPLPRRAESRRTGAGRPRCPSVASLAAGRAGGSEGGKPAGPGRRGASVGKPVWILYCRAARKYLARRGETRQCLAPASQHN